MHRIKLFKRAFGFCLDNGLYEDYLKEKEYINATTSYGKLLRFIYNKGYYNDFRKAQRFI